MTILNVEAWEDIPEWEGLYQASSFGRIRSVDRLDNRGYKRKGVTLSPKMNRGGYLQVVLFNAGTRKMITVHRLVALAFVNGNFKDAVINHIDEDKTNNEPSNLEFCTVAHNNRHSKCKSYYITYPCGKTETIYNLRKFCREQGIQQSNMVQVAKGNPRHKHCSGFKCEVVS